MSTLETFKDTKIGRIPKEWDLVSFSQLGDYYGGVSGKSKDDFGKGKKYIPFMNIMSNDVIDLDFMDFVDIKDDENQNQVMNGDLFFNTSSETPNEVGMCSVLKNCNEEIYLNSFCFGFRLNDKSGKQFIPEYIARFMRSNYGRKIMLPLAQGMTRYNLSKKYFLKLEIPIPTLLEQQKIIKILSTVDEQISLTEKIIEKSKEFKKGLMQKLFSEGIGHTEFKDTKIGRIPKDWEVVKIGNIGTVIDSLHQTPKFSEVGYPMVRVGDINKSKLNLKNCLTVPLDVFKTFTKNHLPTNGDILITRVGSFGKTILVEEDSPFCLGQNTAVISGLKNERYVYYMLNSYPVLKQMGILKNGSTQPSLSLKEIRNIKVAFGSNNEQKK